jgi:hypothetical protein
MRTAFSEEASQRAVRGNTNQSGEGEIRESWDRKK